MKRVLIWVIVTAVVLSVCAFQRAVCAETKTGTIKLAADTVELQLRKDGSRSARDVITLTPSMREVEVEAGTYTPVSIRIIAKQSVEEKPKETTERAAKLKSTEAPATVSPEKLAPETPKPALATSKEAKPKKFDVWTVTGNRNWGKMRKIRVTAGKTTKLKAGPPLILKAKPKQSGQTVQIEAVIVGQLGEEYAASVYKSGKRLDPPKLKIVDESGKVLASGSFAYG